MDFEQYNLHKIKKKQNKTMGECHRMCMKSSDGWKERNISKWEEIL